MFVLGTAGHVDHGKSTLVRALTGIDPDRLKEEKQRGMTIDLGFAWMELAMPKPPQPHAGDVTTPRADVGIVDVPGHIDFIKNMLAGVGGIDAVLFVIAADEGVMPQTREHLAILDLLGVTAGVVALTKCDLIDDPEWLTLVELDVVELLHETNLAGAPIVPVSANTGEGLPALRTALAAVLSALPPRRNRARPRLPIDRVFSLSGFGTVVTGTLLDGALTVGDAVTLLPAGLAARVRSLQTHNQAVESGQPGSRVAINLSGVHTEQVARGDVVAKPGSLEPTQLVDVRFRLLRDAPKPLQHNQRVDFFSGAAELPAVVRLLGAEQLEPGAEGWLQLRLMRPAVVVSGDRFILRQPSPSVTLGGGVVLSPHPRRRWRRFDPAVLSRLQLLAAGAPDDLLLHYLERRPFSTLQQLLHNNDLEHAVAEQALAELRHDGAVMVLDVGAEPHIVTMTVWEKMVTTLRAILAEFHRQAPLRRGMPRGEVRSRLQASAPGADLTVRLFNAFLGVVIEGGLVNADDAVVWLADFQVAYTIHQQAMVDQLLDVFAENPTAPPNQQESLRQLGQDEALLESLLEHGRLLRIGGDVLFRPEDFAAMTARVEAHLRAHGSITLADARDLLQTSRKYVQALLEEMDSRRITRREGDIRLLRGN